MKTELHEPEVVLNAFHRNGVADVVLDEPMSKHTTWRIGGVADVFVCPRTTSELQGAVWAARELGMPWTVIGKGSNLLVLDGGVRGLVIKMGDNFAQISVQGQNVEAQAGRSVVSAVGIAVRHGLAGLEFAYGIPGSVGGAVMMNAGAHGSEVKDVLEWADVMDQSGTIRRFSCSDFRFSYRYSILKDEPGIVVAASFCLEPGDADELMQKVRTWSQRRSSTQPLSLPNCGSVFRNPGGTHAGKLIEESRLKGFRYGDAQISEKHGNFIVNLGNANAADVQRLIRHAQDTVRERYGIELETEVRVLGEPASGR